MLYPQNGDSFVTIDSVTSLHPVYTERYLQAAAAMRPLAATDAGTCLLCD